MSAAAGAYPVVIGANAIDGLGRELDAANIGKRRILVSSHRVWELHGSRFRKIGADRTPIVVDERHKCNSLYR